MVERETDMMLDELRASLAQSGLSFEDYLKAIKKEEKTMREELRRSAELRVRGKIVLRAVADAEKMSVSVAEMEAEIKKLAATSGEPVENLKKRLETEGKKYVEDYMLRQKALDFLVEKAKIKEKKEEKK
jgi:trigger factor